jgi:hypothetical protein
VFGNVFLFRLGFPIHVLVLVGMLCTIYIVHIRNNVMWADDIMRIVLYNIVSPTEHCYGSKECYG